MDYGFHDHFKSCNEHGNACNWTVLQNSDISHLHREWQKGKYRITSPGNRHLPNTPELSEFSLEVQFAAETVIDGTPEIRIFFWYGALQRTGHFINCRIEDNQCVVTFGAERGDAVCIIDEQLAAFDRSQNVSPWTVQLQIHQDTIKVLFEDCPPFVFTAKLNSEQKGHIAFDSGSSCDALDLLDVKITSLEDVYTKVLLPETEIIFPADINGFHTPLRYKISIQQFGDAARLDFELSGSDMENPDVPWFPYHGLIYEMLTAPYVKIGERRLYPAGHDTLVLAQPNPVKQKYFYESLYPKPEWPLQASFFLSQVPEIDTISVGYEYCENEANSKHLSSGPNEAIFDVATQSIVYAGAAVRKGCFILELHSQPDKEICKQIPTSDPRYEAALRFARRNHYFMEAELCHFKAIIRVDENDLLPQELQLHCRLENAFTETIKSIDISRLETVQNTQAGFTEFAVELGPLHLSPGVYHLHFELSFAGRNVVAQRHAFEVLPADPNAAAPPLLSGLPLLFSMPNEMKGLEQDQFEPYLNVENNVAHYLSVTTHYPEIGRKHQIYNVLKLYHREWFLWLTNRITEHPDLEQHRDIVAQCDYIHPPRTHAGVMPFDMWKPQTYSGEVLHVLMDFLRSEALHAHQASQHRPEHECASQPDDSCHFDQSEERAEWRNLAVDVLSNK